MGVGTLLRSSNKQLRARVQELESDLAESAGQLETHKSQVAQHFEQTVIARAKERLSDSDDESLLEAVNVADAETFVVTTEWR